MSKVFKRFLVVVIALVCVAMIVGCSDKKIEYIEVKDGTFKFQYEQDDVVEFEKLIVVVAYNDGTSVEVPYGTNGLSVSELDTSKIGIKSLIIKYSTVEKIIEIRVSTPSASTVVRRAIDALPAVEDLTLEDKERLQEIRADYDALLGEGKAAVTNIAKLVALESLMAELEFNKYISDIKATLDTYAIESEYSETNWNIILGYISNAKTKIDGVESASIKDVDDIVAECKAAIDDVQTIKQEIAGLKSEKLESIAAYKDNEALYSEDSWNQIAVIKANVKTAISNANSIEDINSAYDKAVADIDAIKTLSMELAEYKVAVKANIAELANEYDAVDVEDLKDQACADIDTKTDKAGVDEVKAAFETAICTIPTKDVKAVIAKINAINSAVTLDDEELIKDARSAYTALTADERVLVTNLNKLVESESKLAALKTLENAINDGIADVDEYVESIKDNYYPEQVAEMENYLTTIGKPAINACASSEAVTQVVNSIKEELAKVRNKATQDVFAAIEALPETNAITLENKTAIVEAKEKYDVLTSAEKALVTNYPELESAVNKIAEIELANYRAAVVDEVRVSVNGKQYNEENQAVVEEIITNFINTIENLTSYTAIDAEKATVKNQIAAVKQKHITDVESLIAALPATITLAAQGAIEQAEAQYNDLNDVDKAKVDNYNTLTSAREQLNVLIIENAKTNAKAELDSYKSAENYSPSKWNLILAKKASGTTAIKNAITVEEVTQALQTAKADIDAVPDRNAEAENVEVVGWERPTALANRQSNYEANDGKQFLDTTGVGKYYIGDDNPFKFMPKIVADIEGDRKNSDSHLIELRSIPIVQIKENGAYRDLTPTEAANYYSYSEYTFEFQFYEAALGKSFKLGSKYYYDDRYSYTSALEYIIVDGYNVHKAYELGVMSGIDKWDAHAQLDYTSAWNNFLQGKGVKKPEYVKGIILHDSLSIKSTDIPNTFFVDGYLVDYLDVYEHQVRANDTFLFEGNFFHLSTEELPLCNAETIKGHVTHSTLFKFNMTEYLGNTHFEAEDNTFVRFQNVSTKGNAQMTNDPRFTNERFGGLMFLKHEASQHYMTNVTINTYFINIFGDDDEFHGVMNIDKVQSYQAFQNNIFTYGRTKFNITNSFLGECGGPAIIAQHPHPEDDAEHAAANDGYNDRIPVINVDKNTVITSKVLGTENWFAAFGATSKATEIKVLNAIFRGMGVKGFVNDKGEIDIVMIGMNNSHTPTDISTKTKSVLTLGDAVVADVANHVLSDQRLSMLHGSGAPIFVLSDENGITGMGFYSPTAMPSLGVMEGYNPIGSNQNYVSAGKMYITIYVGGLTVTLSFDGTPIS